MDLTCIRQCMIRQSGVYLAAGAVGAFVGGVLGLAICLQAGIVELFSLAGCWGAGAVAGALGLTTLAVAAMFLRCAGTCPPIEQ